MYREEHDDIWRLAMLIEHYSGVSVTPSDTPELGGDCIVVATLTVSKASQRARDLAMIYGKKLVADNIISLMGDRIPGVVRTALKAVLRFI